MRKLACVSLMLGLVAPIAGARAEGPVDVCHANLDQVPSAGAKSCRTVEQFLKGFGRACRDVAYPETCQNIDGRMIAARLVDEYEGSWAPRALALQRGIDDALPLQEELWAHTHNTFNSEAYDATFSGMDSNQVYSITDQMRMGIRAIEIDVHWAPSAEGLPQDNFRAPIVCHGKTITNGFHLGCTTEVGLHVRLDEVRAWLDAHPGEIVMLYLENQMENDPRAHELAAAAIEGSLGDRVYRPAGTACSPLPMDTSRAQIRATGKQIILTGNCGPGASVWNSWVFDRGPRWKEGGSPAGIDYPGSCDGVRAKDDYAHNWIRWFEDSTWVSAMVTGTGQGATSEVPAEEARRMVTCGVNMIGFDQLKPFDAKLEALVWSWAPDEPKASFDGACAFSGPDGRFHTDDCARPRWIACWTDGGWNLAGPAPFGSECETEPQFRMPHTAYENLQLRAAAGTREVWIDYSHGSSWTPEASG